MTPEEEADKCMGALNVAAVPTPSTKPKLPFPATVHTLLVDKSTERIL